MTNKIVQIYIYIYIYIEREREREREGERERRERERERAIYLTKDTDCFNYINQSNNAVYGNNGCLLSEPYEPHRYIV